MCVQVKCVQLYDAAGMQTLVNVNSVMKWLRFA